MEYVLDFARALTSSAPSRGRKYGGAGAWVQLRIALLGISLGLAIPQLYGVDWANLLPGGVKVELPHGGKVTWPAGEVGLSTLTHLLPHIIPIPVPIPFPRPGGGVAGGSVVGGTSVGAGPGGSIVAGQSVVARFGRCGRGYVGDCVVDGDTFRLAGQKVRVADIDTPETHPARCAREARLGERATVRMQTLLNAGPVTLEAYKRPYDKYGRRLAVVTRDGVSLGERLVREGLARRYDGGHRAGWCGWFSRV